jgi:hypothetical protein
MRINLLSAIMPMVLLTAAAAAAQGLEVVPKTLAADFRPEAGAFDSVSLVNQTAGALRVDSITIRFLDGGATPRPADFTACKTCPSDSIGAYIYAGWLYGSSLNQSLRYLRDSLFLIQDRFGAPVTVNLAPGASSSFALHYPVNCPVCGRPASYPGATRYAFTFIASEGGSAVLNLEVDHATSLAKRAPSLQRAGPGAARDAAGRSNSGAGGAILYREVYRKGSR